jgi:hypothetical protein
MNSSTLENIQTIPEFLETAVGKRTFKSRNAIEWFERVNRKELVRSGVLFKVRGKWVRMQPEYEAKVLEIYRNKSIRAVCK